MLITKQCLFTLLLLLSIQYGCSIGYRYKEYDISIKNVDYILEKEPKQSELHLQVILCNGTNFTFLRINTNHEDQGYVMNLATFYRITQTKDVSKQVIYCIMTTIRSNVTCTRFKYTHPTRNEHYLMCPDNPKGILLDGVYNAGEFNYLPNQPIRKHITFSRVVVCRKQPSLTFFVQATTFWRVNTCFKCIRTDEGA